MSSERSFWVVAMLCPGAFAVAFSEAARRSDLAKGPVLGQRPVAVDLPDAMLPECGLGFIGRQAVRQVDAGPLGGVRQQLD
ncbi:MAG: hypothetical protein ACXWLS_09550, partial [Myxococcaceae bacterium]